jgi:hypothetical protein
MADTEISANTDTKISAETDTETDNFRSLLDTDLHCKRGSRENELLAANCIKKKKKKEKNENRFCFLFETLFNPSLTCTLP